ncbi:Uma2 family endonuclease [Streptomyces sp. NPDC048644]|uniref:Uma2 family endonuclease n=1 Tax=Streptomyces sp. NPDC048644 TaxID=3365582 RepID=UPI0037181708
MAHEPMPTQTDILLEGFLALDTPSGFRAELIEGEIVATPPPDGDHEYYLSTVFKQVLRKSATPMDLSGHKGLILSGTGARPADHVIPDATFAPEALRLFQGAPPWMPSDGVAMVVEVTSSKPYADRVAKRHGYARAGIPLYLLVDRDKSATTLFSEPEKGDYLTRHTALFGKSIALPAPFSFDLETGDFL